MQVQHGGFQSYIAEPVRERPQVHSIASAARIVVAPNYNGAA